VSQLRILLATDHPNSPSYIFYAASLERINNEANLGAAVTVFTSTAGIDYSGFDVALFLGGSSQAAAAKAANPQIVTGLVDPRYSQSNEFKFVDLLITQGIEARDYFAGQAPNVLIYETYPDVPEPLGAAEQSTLKLGYHGNRIHLEAMFPRITDAIEILASQIKLELVAMYNIEMLGKSSRIVTERLGFPVRHVQFGHEGYAAYIAHVDIGLVPQMIPVRESALLKYLLGSPSRRFNESQADFLLRFKETTNIGRHLVFAQYGIPVVSDMSPSACSLIDHGVDGFLANSTAGWLASLRALSSDPGLRSRCGRALKEKWRDEYSHDVLNRRLVRALHVLRRDKGKV